MDKHKKNKKGSIVVLVTAVGIVTGNTVVNELKKASDNIKVIGTDVNPANRIVASKYVDEFYQFPSAIEDQESYFVFLKEFCEKHKVQFIYCFVDEEVVNLTRHRKELEKIGVKLCGADQQTVEICHFKDRFSEWIEEFFPQIAIRRFKALGEIKDEDFPLFVKPIEGRASIGCAIVNGRKELNNVLREDKMLIQEYVQGDIISVDIIRNRITKQFEIVQKRELLRNKNGCGIAVEIVDLYGMKKLCRDIAERLDLNGVINAEFFYKEKELKIIEINPRLSAGTSYSCMAGCNLVINALRIAREETCQFGEVSIGKFFARRYETYEM